jgi:chromosome segregation ATPase
MPASSSSVSLETGKAESWGTAGKVSQLQSMIHDRLKYLEDQQRQYWEQLQLMDRVQGDMRQEAATAARDAAETVIHKQCGILREEIGNQAVRAAQETAANVAREAAASAAREAAIAARDAAASVAREAALDAAREAASAAAQQIKRDMQIAQEEALRHAAENIQQACKQEVNELRAHISRQDDESARIKSACEAMKQDLSKIFTELERLERVKVDKDELLQLLNKQKSQLESSIADLRRSIDDDIKRAVRDAVRNEVANMKPREPEPKKEPPRPATPEPTPEFKQAPKETYVILKGAADNSIHYLCDLENSLGRSNTCSAMVGQSQSISNQHASISVSAKGAVLRDLGSRNGTWLNDRRVGEHEGLSIQSGDAIQLGVDGPSFFSNGGLQQQRCFRENTML